MRTVIRYLKLYGRFFTATTMANLAYKTDFIVWSLVTIGWFLWNLVFYEILFTQVDQIAGWSKGQVMILQGYYWLTEFVVWGLIYANVHELPARIARGKLDGDIVKPINLQFLLSCQKFNQNQLNSVVLGIATIVYGMNLAGASWNWDKVVFSLVIFIVGSIFIYSGYFATVCLAFWFERLQNIIYAFPELRHLSKVPFPAYTGITKVIFAYIIPITLVTTLPSQFLFGQPDWPLAGWLSLVSIIALWFSSRMLQWGLRRYSSASS